MNGMVVYSKAKNAWLNVTPSRGRALADARLQLHHAAQFVACFGISYLPRQEDDSHTNMEWIGGLLASQPAGDARPFRLAVRVDPLSVVLFAGTEIASYALDGKTIDEGARWIRARVSELGLDGDRYSLARHYVIPSHGVDRGLPFDTTDGDSFAELSRWLGDAALMLEDIARGRTDASPVRCWPHHFDIATLVNTSPSKTIGLGMEPGDVYYDEPYWYANATPPIPENARHDPLPGGAFWHTEEWVGAVLPASRMRDGDAQRSQVAEFLRHFLPADG